ncbi:MAG: hypothetical protein ACLTYW_04515 [Collinsella sp.]
MEKILFACDELTGLIGAAVIMRRARASWTLRPSRSRKVQGQALAAGCSRDVITQGAEMLGWSSRTLDRTIAAMQSFAPDRDTFQPNIKTTTKGQALCGGFNLHRDGLTCLADRPLPTPVKR